MIAQTLASFRIRFVAVSCICTFLNISLHGAEPKPLEKFIILSPEQQNQPAGRKDRSFDRTLEVRCKLTGKEPPLKIDMFATVMIVVGEEEAPIAVPVSAIQRINSETMVFVVLSPGHFEKREIEVGRRGEEWVEVTRSLKGGESVVGEGSFL